MLTCLQVGDSAISFEWQMGALANRELYCRLVFWGRTGSGIDLGYCGSEGTVRALCVVVC